MPKQKNDKYEQLLQITTELFNHVDELSNELEKLKQKLNILEFKNN